MEFKTKTDLLIQDLVRSSEVIGSVVSAPPAFVERMLIQGCFQLIAHCKEQHGVDVPVSVDELLAHTVGEEGVVAAKKYCEDSGEPSLVKVLATPFDRADNQA